MKPLRTVILAKAPRPGLAKTRLIPALGASGAAQLAHRMLQHTLQQALAAGLGPVELCRTPPETSKVNWPSAGATLANLGLPRVGGENSIEIRCGGAGRTHVIVDSQGYVPFIA